jgi:hypothetical protein
MTYDLTVFRNAFRAVYRHGTADSERFQQPFTNHFGRLGSCDLLQNKP